MSDTATAEPSQSNWITVAPADSVAEKGFASFVVEGQPVVICRFRDEYFAVENLCSHALSTFDGGRLRAYRIMCPLHGATFDVRDGSCTGAPANRPIRSFALRVNDGMLQVDLTATATPSG